MTMSYKYQCFPLPCLTLILFRWKDIIVSIVIKLVKLYLGRPGVQAVAFSANFYHYVHESNL